jgi:uncharacterized protein YbjT (DUF2867 family)
MTKSTALLGATGLVGKQILELLGSYAPVEVWSRRPLLVPVGARAHLSPDLPPEGDNFWRVDVVFVALGTTIGKAGSQEAFEAVDFGLVVEAARRARAAGCTTLALVSAMGAKSDSNIFYNRVKGRAEAAVLELGFPRVAIARPSLLLGDRAERRPSEWLMRKLLGPIRFLFPRALRPVRDVEVALALVDATRDDSWSGTRILENSDLAGSS